MSIFPSTFSGKTPIDVLPFGFDLTDWLVVDPATGVQDTLVSAVMTAVPPDGSLTIGPVTVLPAVTFASVSGGIVGTTYVLTVVARTLSGMVVQCDESLPVTASVR